MMVKGQSCDTCGRPIAELSDGTIVWMPSKPTFRIVHRWRGPVDLHLVGCETWVWRELPRVQLGLDELAGAEGVRRLLDILDKLKDLADVRDWARFCRRLYA